MDKHYEIPHRNTRNNNNNNNGSDVMKEDLEDTPMDNETPPQYLHPFPRDAYFTSSSRVREHPHPEDQEYMNHGKTNASCSMCQKNVIVGRAVHTFECGHVACQSCTYSHHYNASVCPACYMIGLHEKEVMRILSKNIKTDYSDIIERFDVDCRDSELVFINDEVKEGGRNSDEESRQNNILHNSTLSAAFSGVSFIIVTAIFSIVLTTFVIDGK